MVDSINTENKNRSLSITLGNSDAGEKYIIAFVGLPARGKSYLSRKLATFLNWMGYESKVFSFGLYRRSLVGVDFDWRFFEEENKETQSLRENVITRALDDLLSFFQSSGRVGIIDGTNIRKEKRRSIEDYVRENISRDISYTFMWIESVCTIKEVVEQNILINKLKSPDYKDWPEEKAAADFRDRISIFEKVYDHLSIQNDGEHCTYIALFDFNKEIVVRNVKGFLQSKLLSFIVNIIPCGRPIYFIRHGLSESDHDGVIGEDKDLSKLGKEYAEKILDFFSKEDFVKNKNLFKEECSIYCSTMKRSLHTAQILTSLGRIHTRKCLDDINVGIFDGMSNNEIREKFPKEYEERIKDKLNYRYPRGESYKDLILRIEPIIHELERSQGPIIIVGHQAPLRCLYGYLTNTPLQFIPQIDIPNNTVIKKVPQAYGFNEIRFKIDESKCDSINEGFPIKSKKESYTNFEDSLYSMPV